MPVRRGQRWDRQVRIRDVVDLGGDAGPVVVRSGIERVHPHDVAEG